MNEKDFYLTIDKPSTAEFKDRGSKFIAHAFAIETADDFKKQLQLLKKGHPKAVHHCFAYRIGSDGNNFRSSDDGEPSGTAGKPILGQIDSKGVSNIAIVVVRYWGGTLLGVPGLINAYKTVAALALQVTPVIEKQIETAYSSEFDYTQMNEVMMVVKQFDCVVEKQETQLFCSMNIGVPQNWLAEVENKLNDLRGVELEKISL